MKNRIDWDDPRLNSTVYEDMVSVLISRLYPRVQRIDGSGGDEGRDVLMELPTGLEIFELKSFTRRLTNSRRQQIKRSLKRAAAHNPKAWHLVVPINPTGKELDWFKGITEPLEFQCDWLGLTWLEDMMAQHLDIPRYFLEGANDEVVHLLTELNKEQAVLKNGVSDAVERIEALAHRLNELDPYYNFGFTYHPGKPVSITVLPRYEGADKDRPIQMNGKFRFPNTPEGKKAALALQETLYYGTPSTIVGKFIESFKIDGPLGIKSNTISDKLHLEALRDQSAKNIFANLVVENVESGDTIVQVPLQGVERTTGQRGGEIKLTDPEGALSVIMRIDTVTNQVNLKYTYHQPENKLPISFLPTLKFSGEMHSGNQLLIELEGKRMDPPFQLQGEANESLLSEIRLIQNLADIQQFSGKYFPTPKKFTRDEAININHVHKLVTGETLNGTWNHLSFQTSASLLEKTDFSNYKDEELTSFFTETALELSIGGRGYLIGKVRTSYESAIIKEWQKPVGDTVSLTLVPGSSNVFSTKLTGATKLLNPGNII